jgi:ankyrin repeat protein
MKQFMELLLDRADMDANSKDVDGLSAPALASMSVHEAMVRLLLDRIDVDVKSKANTGETPLFARRSLQAQIHKSSSSR